MQNVFSDLFNSIVKCQHPQNSVAESHHQDQCSNYFTWQEGIVDSGLAQSEKRSIWVALTEGGKKEILQNTRREASRPSLVHLTGSFAFMPQMLFAPELVCALLCLWLMWEHTVGQLHPAGTISLLVASHREPIWNLAPQQEDDKDDQHQLPKLHKPLPYLLFPLL